MRRPPLLATLFVAAAVATMIGLGVWQLQRRTEKTQLLARLERDRGAPLVDLTARALPPDIGYRRARLQLRCSEQLYDARAGRNAAGQSGWVWRGPCRTESGEDVTVVAGWTRESSKTGDWALPRDFVATGQLAPPDAGTRARFFLDKPPPGLLAAAPPGPDSLPNNHLLYAIQWFFFAGAAAVIYLLALRRRHR